MSSPAVRRFVAFAASVLGLLVLVALWGALVRATGSGAGCGNHWPLCNGEVLPRSPVVETMIELVHRLTSALVGLGVLALVVLARRRFGRRHRVTLAAWATLALTVVEALIGAGLVRFELVGENASVTRAVVMAAHLVNTFLLLGAAALVVLWARGTPPPRLAGRGASGLLVGLGAAALALLGASGAVTALGDTLFPVADLRAGLLPELSPAGRLLVRLRILHPVLAVGLGVVVVGVGWALARLRPAPRVALWARSITALYVVQIAVGLVNVALAAPVALQIVHLALAYFVWLAFVALGGEALAGPGAGAGAEEPSTPRLAAAAHRDR